MRAVARAARVVAIPRARARRRIAARRAARDDGDAARRFVAPNESATAKIARALARVAREGDVICLRGAVGAGKSAFARAFVRAATLDASRDVPSPTYLVQQRYDVDDDDDATRGGKSVHHYDLYRLRDEAEIEAMVDLRESAARAVSVVEWSERLGRLTPETRLEVRVRAIERRRGRARARSSMVRTRQGTRRRRRRRKTTRRRKWTRRTWTSPRDRFGSSVSAATGRIESRECRRNNGARDAK